MNNFNSRSFSKYRILKIREDNFVTMIELLDYWTMYVYCIYIQIESEIRKLLYIYTEFVIRTNVIINFDHNWPCDRWSTLNISIKTFQVRNTTDMSYIFVCDLLQVRNTTDMSYIFVCDLLQVGGVLPFPP
jgi:hypothetical protein